MTQTIIKNKKGWMKMSLVTIKKHYQITIPSKLRKLLKIGIGDILEAEIKDNKLILKPKELIDKDQAWFWTKEWQQEEKQADQDIKTGKVAGPFKDAKTLLKNLKA